MTKKSDSLLFIKKIRYFKLLSILYLYYKLELYFLTIWRTHEQTDKKKLTILQTNGLNKH